jgi:hypothetical protein
MIRQTVILTADQWAWAVRVGTARDESSKAKGQVGRSGQSPAKSLQNNIDGAAAELAVAIALGIEWPAGVDTYLTQPDLTVPGVGGVEVKWSARVGLIILDTPQADQVHVLCMGTGAVKHIVGWADRERIKQLKSTPKQDLGNGRPPVWLITPEALNDWGLFPKKGGTYAEAR